jgi:hypothetical protein
MARFPIGKATKLLAQIGEDFQVDVAGFLANLTQSCLLRGFTRFDVALGKAHFIARGPDEQQDLLAAVSRHHAAGGEVEDRNLAFGHRAASSCIFDEGGPHKSAFSVRPSSLVTAQSPHFPWRN